MDLLTKEEVDNLFANVQDGYFVVGETLYIEFKSNFNISNISEYIWTSAGLANAQGGYIICGVHPDTKKLIGLDEKAKTMFKKVDDEGFRGKFLNRAKPEIIYQPMMYEFLGESYIVFKISECKYKPIVFSANGDGVFKEGEIAYRYSDSIKLIKQAELHQIIDSRRKQEQDKWMEFLSKIATVGIDNMILINAKNGTLIQPNDHSIVLDKSVLEKLVYI